jgi:UDP-N-acetylmuramate dehydrogenase
MEETLKTYFSSPPPEFSGEIKFDEKLARYTYYQIGGVAAVFATPKTKSDLLWIWNGVRQTGAKVFLLGAGSNILISDAGFPGVVIRLGRLNQELSIHPSRPDRLLAGGSLMISMILRRAGQEGWGGLEFLAGIPGTIGGAVRMNAGTHLGETAGRLREVEAMILNPSGDSSVTVPLTTRSYLADELKFQYRKNLFLPENAVVWFTEWEIEPKDPVAVKQAIDETLLRRKQTQPVDYPSCGSVFKNPKESGLSAWQVLDRLGLRGHQIGNAQIAEKHSNFIINLGGASASDVRALIELAKTRALNELGITLQEEVLFVGF